VVLDLDHLEALARAASPGPWSTEETAVLDRDGFSIISSDFGHSCADVGSLEDAVFIVAARDAVPALLARVRELARKSAKAVAIDEAAYLDHVDVLVNAASQAPWALRGRELIDGMGESLLSSEFGDLWGELDRPGDAAFIAAARELVPSLVARVRALEAANGPRRGSR
jgi:hypothetical protein